MKRFFTFIVLLYIALFTWSCDNTLPVEIAPLQARLDELTFKLETLLNDPTIKQIDELEDKLKGMYDSIGDPITKDRETEIIGELNSIEEEIERLKNTDEYIKLNIEINTLTEEINKLIDEINAA